MMASANTGGFRLVRCPKCLNILPEPANVSVYQCGGCNTTLRAKIRVSDAQNVTTKQVRQDPRDYSVVPTVSNGVSTKQVRQDSGSYSVVTSVSNGVSPQSKELGSIGAAADDSITLNSPSTEIEQESSGTGSSEKGDIMSDEENVMEAANTESSDDSSDGLDINGEMEDLPALIQPSGNGTQIVDSDKEENPVEQSAENSEICIINEDGDDMESSRNTSDSEQNNLLESEERESARNLPEPEERELARNLPESEEREIASKLPEPEESAACKTDPASSKRSKLVRVQSRSCDLREVHGASADSLDFHSSRTSFQSKSFRASDPLQSKIMKTVDELKDDLSEIFSKPSDCKPRAHPTHPLKQDGYKPHVTVTSSQPLTAYHPAVKHSGIASRMSRSGQVAPHPHPHGHGLPLPRYRRRNAYSNIHSGQLEMRACPHQCHHTCHPPCCSSWKQEPEPHKPPAKEIKRRPASRNLCRPVLRGAPFILCSNCLKLVQLPTDFAIPSRGTRRLQCGSCAHVLSYSYRDPSRKKLQSPFGVDESTTDDFETRHVGGDHQADPYPYSYSEEYGISAGVSYSTEDEQPLHVSRNSSFNTIDERSTKESKLHRLMGYSSASELMRRSPDLYESFSRPKPNARAYDVKGKGVCMTNDGSDAKHGAVKGSKAKERSRGLPFQRMFKKKNHGLESLKLRSEVI